MNRNYLSGSNQFIICLLGYISIYSKRRKCCNFATKNSRRAWHVIPTQEVKPVSDISRLAALSRWRTKRTNERTFVGGRWTPCSWHAVLPEGWCTTRLNGVEAEIAPRSRKRPVYRQSAHVHARRAGPRTRSRWYVASARYEFLCTKVHVRNIIYRAVRRARARTDAWAMQWSAVLLVRGFVRGVLSNARISVDAHREDRDKEIER